MQGIAQFLRERQYLHNVAPRTIEWYEYSLRWLPNEAPTQADLNDTVVRMREKGLKATGCNCTIRAINAYLKWCGSPLKIRPLKEPKLVMPTYTEAQIKKLIAYKPRNKYERRLHTLVLFLLDTGCRISEALTLRARDIDMDNLLVTLDGKGRKQRVVPISFELRKILFRYCKEVGSDAELLVFGNRNKTLLNRDNVRRDVKTLCERIGFAAPPRLVHAFRHTFAVNYLRRGGSVFHLQKVLGHSSLEMTRRYANLVTADLQAVHERVSLLSCR
jgi:integrase/recombinase XerD